MLSIEWALKYQEGHKWVIIYTVILSSQVLSYGKLLEAEYQDEDYIAYKVLVETSKRTGELLLLENNLVFSRCHPVELRHILSGSDYIIIALEPFIEGRVSFASSDEASSNDRTVKAK